ncbi:unnamed protein product [Durusdinium trenchii]|uniref:Uncharacterized protein n=1 Tax=Durusdinium trenchii TaxID=1381693 RepID=A0ABP0NF99_9DINO
MVRLLHARRAVLATVEVNDGQLRVTSVGPLRQLWFQGKDGQHLQTEVVLRDGQVDLRRSLRRTPYLNFMALCRCERSAGLRFGWRLAASCAELLGNSGLSPGALRGSA